MKWIEILLQIFISRNLSQSQKETKAPPRPCSRPSATSILSSYSGCEASSGPTFITDISPLLSRFASLSNLEEKKHRELQQIGLAYFLYLFLYSGMEFTLTFLTHIRFNFSPMEQVRTVLFLSDWPG